ncbi:secretogranin_V domain-containing protein 7B2 isoform X2 [Rhodnius prolixus]|uniref:secretogranin_V domain-containing protein 7B2 isoform X2 n=1 Tax=Rhodnius prolixus TaxID=13249 RepID=UPI003D18C98B
MGLPGLLILVVCAYGTLAYFATPKDHSGLSEFLLREVVEKMGRDLDNYLDEVSTGRLIYPPLISRSDKDSDYQDNPIPRDHEYLQHSTLLSGPFLQQQDSNDKATSSLQNINGNSESQQTGSKQDNLPAYCNPPNPCPIGYSVEDGCLEDFENTAAFSREYQARQDCMCDSEHMFDCTNPRNSDGITQSDLDRLVQQFHVEDEHKTLVAKKYHEKKSTNPYLLGEKLPVAAKKGINIGY